MELRSAEIWIFFGLAFMFQIAALSFRRTLFSLFFSLLHSIVISVILIAISQFYLALASLWLTSGLSYFGLIQTSFLIGKHDNQKPKRRITISLFIYTAVVSALTGLFAFLASSSPNSFEWVNPARNTSMQSTMTSEYSAVLLLISIMALSSLISVFLLIRQDDTPFKV